MPLPPFLLTALDPIRASGRLFWPVGYVMVLMAILAIYRLSAERAAMLLVAVIALQIVDMGGMAAMIRAQSRAADAHRLYTLTRDPRWDGLLRRSNSVAFMPGDVTRNLDVFQEISWRAIDLGRPVANVYAARMGQATIDRLVQERAAFDRGHLVAGRLYVVRPGARVPATAAADMMTLDGVTVVAPRHAAQ